jgi:hypothetical protein
MAWTAQALEVLLHESMADNAAARRQLVDAQQQLFAMQDTCAP